jgi:serine/threonine-protein kinase
MGSVYKAQREDLRRIVALKVLQPRQILETMLGRQEIRSRFFQEARIMATRDHRNIAAVWDLGEADDTPYMAMEYFCMNLGTLIGESSIIEAPSRSLPPLTALDYTRQTLEGLACLHQAGIVHRDIKPFNLMLTGDGCIKIIDLGLSKVRGERRSTPRGLKVGSPYYAAPEQEGNPEKADVRADLYAAGVLLHRLMTGLLPEKDLALADHPLLSDTWRKFFQRALTHDPHERFDNAWRMADALDDLERDWLSRQEAECILKDIPLAESPANPSRLRHTPIRTGVRDRAPFATLDDLFQPKVYWLNDFAVLPTGVFDRSSKLTWRARISRLPMAWDETGAYLADLNRDRKGKRPWRLPTVEELVTLLCPKKSIEDFCSPAWFDQNKPWLWTSDRRSFISAWFVDVASGAVGWQDFTCRFHVLAVASP